MIFAFVFVCLSPRDPRGSVVWDALSSASFEKDSISIPLTQTACEREGEERGREGGREGGETQEENKSRWKQRKKGRNV